MSGTSRRLSGQGLSDWLRLARTPQVGPVSFAGLIGRYGSAGKALEALPHLARRGGRIDPLKIPSREMAEAEICALEDMGGQMLPACDPDFPALLTALDPPPPILSLLGDASLLGRPACAMVGARNASAAGMRLAGNIASGLGAFDYVIVSGLARGIDGAAHAGALEGGTIAVVAGGVDHVYPPEHADLRAQIIKHGLIVSERRLGHRVTARDFPRRNRLISGLASGCVVIEAARRSGSLITARYALEQGREIMATPGSPLDPRAQGTNDLIRKGGLLVQTAADIHEALNNQRPPRLLEDDADYRAAEPATAPLDESAIDEVRERLHALLSLTPVPRDELIRQCGIDPAVCMAALLELELAGRAELLPGGMIISAQDQNA